MNNPFRLAVEDLYQPVEPESLPFETTDDVDLSPSIVGQDRAVRAIEFGIGIRRPGYNIFALGSPGTGKHSVVRSFLSEQAKDDPVPADLCYVYNFDEPHRPRALALPPGVANRLRAAMDGLVEELSTVVPAAFESDEFRVRRQAAEATFQSRQEEALGGLRTSAREVGLDLLRTPSGLVIAPIRDGEVIDQETFQKLPEEEQESMRKEIERFQGELQQILQKIPTWEREMRSELRALRQEIARFAGEPLFHELREQFGELGPIADYLTNVQADVLENLELFVDRKGDGERQGPGPAPQIRNQDTFMRYRVNVIVDHGDRQGAPVVYEDNPAYQNLVGRVEYVPQMGGLTTDFTHIKPGALHAANGGYLMIDAHKLLTQPYAWEGLKRALRAGEIRIETPGQMMSQVNAVTLEPDPIGLDIKIALIGDSALYYALSQSDPDFPDLFKIMADFDDVMDRTQESQVQYARLLGRLARSRDLRPLTQEAVARVIEHSARMANDGEKLSMRVSTVTDLLVEADYLARREDEETIRREHIDAALDAQRERAWRIPERSQEAILRGVIAVETEGEVVGQINGLSVMQLGGVAFGRPNRITARVGMGRGEFVDIEREVALGGRLHSKGVLILSSFINARYAHSHPLSLHASLVFEQSYGGVDGDSASSAELYALLSAISKIPIRQGIAVTGSVDQFGNVQAIGGVNEKIEGFFAICRERGLNGEQGVMIPRDNLDHLMLRAEVRDAVQQDRFQILAVDHIDEGIQILTGVPAGERDESGRFPTGTVNGEVESNLLEMAERWVEFHRQAGVSP